MSWISSTFGALKERELPAKSLSLRQVFRQRYLELTEHGCSLDGIAAAPREPSNCLNLDANPFLGRDHLALSPLQISK